MTDGYWVLGEEVLALKGTGCCWAAVDRVMGSGALRGERTREISSIVGWQVIFLQDLNLFHLTAAVGGQEQVFAEANPMQIHRTNIHELQIHPTHSR